MRFLHSPGSNHKVIFLLCISSELQACMCKHTNGTHTHTHTKTTLKKVPFVCSTLMKSYPLRTSITLENELETCCNPDSVIKPVSQSAGRGGNSHRPSSVWRVAPNETRRYREPLQCRIYVWHNEAIWLCILHCMSINPQMSNIQTKEIMHILILLIVDDNTLSWQMITKPHQIHVPTHSEAMRCAHGHARTNKRAVRETHTYTEQDKPPHAVRG